MPPISRRLVLAAGLSTTFGVAACAPAGLEASNSPAPTPEPTPETSTGEETTTPETSAPVEQSPTPEPTPTPKADPTAVMPGANHNGSAKEYAYPAADVQAWLEKKSTPEEKVVFLTFDDGPNHSTTVQILDILKEHEVPATFFVVGKIVSGAPDVLKREIAEGHSVALHSYTHDYKKLYPGRKAKVETIMDEFHRTKEDIRAVLGEDFDTSCWRYPGGHMSWKNIEPADEALAAENCHWVDWNCMTGDAEPESRRPKSAREMKNMAVSPIFEEKNVSVMLAHDSEGKDLTVQALPEIIAEYKKAGYKFGVIA
ncbi:MAG: polysaccharide deacetylase family protein [Arachnia propionica]|uniref:polysaccharide deacetylase family protein n=1 Tax=Arachnia propionica TaxID=1750 RepID=UPI0026FB62F7|nr:polysaccharide deacetylase family protein [Arachnia propionica]